MAAKYLHSLADENPDLQKQIGCMTGVFQIFNRHHIVSRRRIFSHSAKRGDPDNLVLNNGTPQRESSLMGQRHLTVEKRRTSVESSKESSASRLMNGQNLDLRDVVKDSMYREARGLSRNYVTKKESNDWYGDEPIELSRSKSCQFRDRIPSSACKDYPQFYFDGRETDSKTINQKKLKELPRLSLDGKERSIRTLSLFPVKPSNSKSNHSRNLKTNNRPDADKDLSQTRPPNVVAKLIGLETFSPDDCGSIIKTTNSTRSSLKEPRSLCRKDPNIKPISRAPIEPAPWKQQNDTRVRSSSKICSPVSSVYSEVDKRLKNLEFAESGKNLRALKQILEAMQAVEARKDERQETIDTSSDQDHQNPPCVSRELGVSSGHESHIVIMKPTKLVKKCVTDNKTRKDLITESTHRERRSRSSTPHTNTSKPRKHLNKQQSESRSPSERRKPSNFQKINDQNRETQMLSEYSEESNSMQSSSSTPEETTLIMRLGVPLTPEYPSPVSVLDDSIYVDDSPSPVKHTPFCKKDDATDKIVKDGYKATTNVQSNTISRVLFQTNRDKLKKVEDLVKKLKNLNSDHNEPRTDYIASLCENTNPDDRYISEIFLASGFLLRDPESFELHPSGHPINPELFLVLEHTKFSNLPKEKFHRKLIFDVVNEILVGKLSSVSGMMLMQDPRKLLREVCLEIEQLRVRKKRAGCEVGYEGDGDDDLKSILWEDVLKKSESWTDFCGETAVIAMEVERLILIDLVNEVIMSQACEGK
ncbi:hypothetical protein SSX86_024894 [Deinandra increscens subsp. villosa]|uniref:DUF4378 domain-containing protein n=1 Tax=Deinandra increscens subsp. villosa TaxID=3103831 RepID=A0AAP0GMQ1_9ASTR